MIILVDMKDKKARPRWFPAVLMMAVIFTFSSIPASEMPKFGLWDLLVKKGGHVLGYGLLALAYWYWLGWNKKRWWIAFLLAVLYAISDEFHQSFVLGRLASWVDALAIDGSGAVIALAVWALVRRKS